MQNPMVNSNLANTHMYRVLKETLIKGLIRNLGPCSTHFNFVNMPGNEARL